MIKKIIISGLLFFASVCLASESTITLMVPYPSGGHSERIAKKIQGYLESDLNKKIQLTYKPGAAGNIAMREVANNKDTSVVILITNATAPTDDYDYSKLKPVALLGEHQMVLATSKESGIRNMEDWLKLSKGSKLLAGASGVGSQTHLCMFQLLNKTNKNGTFVHYKGATAFIPDLVENRLQTSCLFGKDILDYVNTGKLNVIAVTSPQRLEKFPQIPTLKELNMNYAALPMWIGITSNPNADEVTINQIKNSLRKMVNDKTIVEEFLRDVDITIRPEKFDTLKTRITEDFPYYLNMINH